MSTRFKHVYNDRRWKIIRAEALRRAGNVCQIRLPGCTQRATAGDHIVSLEDGGAPFALSNVQACCTACNSAKEGYRRLGIPTASTLTDVEQGHVRWSRQWWECRCPGCQQRRASHGYAATE